jgi:hypothetical protein
MSPYTVLVEQAPVCIWGVEDTTGSKFKVPALCKDWSGQGYMYRSVWNTCKRSCFRFDARRYPTLQLLHQLNRLFRQRKGQNLSSISTTILSFPILSHTVCGNILAKCAK